MNPRTEARYLHTRTQLFRRYNKLIGEEEYLDLIEQIEQGSKSRDLGEIQGGRNLYQVWMGCDGLCVFLVYDRAEKEITTALAQAFPKVKRALARWILAHPEEQRRVEANRATEQRKRARRKSLKHTDRERWYALTAGKRECDRRWKRRKDRGD